MFEEPAQPAAAAAEGAPGPAGSIPSPVSGKASRPGDATRRVRSQK